MGTNIRPEVSERNKYYLEKHRYYELKHFCLQYPIWKKAYKGVDGLSKSKAGLESIVKSTGTSDPTGKCAEAKLFWSERMTMIEETAKEAAGELSDYILEAVTNGYSYDVLKARLGIPCCKETYYTLYRRFFWMLNKVRE